jgi:predicted nuclease with TOPRIM domain
MGDNTLARWTWQEVSAFLAVTAIFARAIWQLIKGRVEHERLHLDAKLQREQELIGRENLAYEHLQDLLKPYREELQLLRDSRTMLEDRMDQQEKRVDELEKENKTLRLGIRKLCEQLLTLDVVPVFCFDDHVRPVANP